MSPGPADLLSGFYSLACLLMDSVFACLTDFAVGGASFELTVQPSVVAVEFRSAGNFDHFVRWCLDSGTVYSFPVGDEHPYRVILPLA